MQSLRIFGAGCAAIAAISLCCPAHADNQTLLRGHLSVNDYGPIPSDVQIEIKHQRTLALRDMGEIVADLQLAQKNYNRLKELFDEQIVAAKDLDAAEAVLKKKKIDLLTRKAALDENEAAILRKHHLPAPPAPVVSEDDINRILQEGTTSSHTYAEIR